MEKTYKLIGSRPNGTILYRSNNIRYKGIDVVRLEAITEKEEERIDHSKAYFDGATTFCKGDKIIAQDKQILMYGEINFESKEDIKLIEKFNLIADNGNCIYSNVDNDGSVRTVDGLLLWYPTFDKIEWFKYCHMLIGKPKRIIVYRDNINANGRRII